jgi:hypothetical protein
MREMNLESEEGPKSKFRYIGIRKPGKAKTEKKNKAIDPSQQKKALRV